MKGPLGLLLWADTLDDPLAITPLDLYNLDVENKKRAESVQVVKIQTNDQFESIAA